MATHGRAGVTFRHMKRWLLVLAILACGCGSASNNDPAHYGTVKVRIAFDDDGTIKTAVEGLSALGPDVQVVDSGEDVTLTLGGYAAGPLDCFATYTATTHTITLLDPANCPGVSPNVDHAQLVTMATSETLRMLGYFMGMHDTDGRSGAAIMKGTEGAFPTATADGWERYLAFDFYTQTSPTPIDIAEYQRTHP